MLSTEQQRDLFVEVGTFVSHENPWKQISKQYLEDHLSTDTYEMKVLKEKLKEIEDESLLLIGYIPHMSDETQDTFIIYLDELTCKEASEIVKRLEAVDRHKIKKSIVKIPRAYQSMGSENEVDMYVKTTRTNLVDVELQSVYPMRFTNSKLGFRFADDARDGYAELVPGKRVNIENVHRIMIDRSIQSGPMKVVQEQQTDPTFPTNAWSQYYYDMEEESLRTNDAETETIASEKTKDDDDDVSTMFRRKKSKEEMPIEVVIEEPVVSKQVEELLEILEFNQVDMYRNDYPFIAKSEVQKYQTPYIEEVCCFAYIAKCKGRFVTSMDWHPEFSGICVVSYGFNLKTKIIRDEMDVDVVKRTIIERNPVLVWGFDDPLYPKLELEAIREISCISFCPYNGNVIVGGTVNGQIIIWDISNRLQKLDVEERLTPNQIRNRSEIREFMNWSLLDDSSKIVQPAAISNIEKSHDNAITNIKWIATNYQCTSKGLLKQDREHNTQYRHFVTTSIDGNICFWSLDWAPAADEAAKIVKIVHKVNLPPELKEESSPFKAIDGMFYPHYKLSLTRPILGFTFNEGDFEYEPIEKQISSDITQRIHHKIIPLKKESFNPKMVTGSSIGDLILCSWEGSDFSNGAAVDPKTMIQETFAAIHDGPITAINRNPFLPDVFISLGGFIFSLWHDDFKEFPILWRRRESRLTGFQWSLDRPSVFFLICENGSLEIWDLMSRIDMPSLKESLGGNMLTAVLQHKLTSTKRLLAIADFNTNLRIFMIPNGFVAKLQDETDAFAKMIDDEVKRKRNQEVWKVEWYESNKDIVEAKKLAEEQVNEDAERKERMRKEIEEKRAAMAEAEAKK